MFVAKKRTFDIGNCVLDSTMFTAVLISLFWLAVNGQQYFSNKSTVPYDPGELLSQIFSGNATQSRRMVKFDEQHDSDLVSFDDQHLKAPSSEPFRFQVNQETNNNIYSYDENRITHVKFDNSAQSLSEDVILNSLSNGIQPVHEGNGGKKKKRRRRKPKQQISHQPGFVNPEYPGPIGPAHGPNQNFGPNRFRPEFNGQFYRPPRRPQSSLATDALTAVTGALTSIAHNDDYQCVARLLCEAAAGGALGGSSILESVSGLQPLLTLLSAYNGISSNPLFVFGRAAFLGMSSKGNPGSCRYAYPLCPTDPEQLVHYLNNHNGGFFRFFNAPQQGQQNLQQFYNQLSQNYGLYQPGSGSNQEFYGLLNQGLHQHPGNQPNLYPNGYGYHQNYGFAYPYNQNYINGNGVRFKNHNYLTDNDNQIAFNNDGNKIEKRIQNKPSNSLNDNSGVVNSKWLFPGEDEQDEDGDLIGVQYVNAEDFGFTDYRKDKTFRFPDNQAFNIDSDYYYRPTNFYSKETQRKPKAISFPDSQNKVNNYIPAQSNDQNFFFNNVNREIRENYKRMHYDYNSNNNNNDNYRDTPGTTTVYVVRGNGDPNHPEIIKLRPGETL